MAQFGYDGEPRNYSNLVVPQDIARLSERLAAAGLGGGHKHNVTELLSQPGNQVIEEGESAHIFHRSEPPQVHFAIGNMATGAPAAGIRHLVLSAEPTGLIILSGNQAAFNKDPVAATILPGVLSADTQGAEIQLYAGKEGWFVYDAIAHYVSTIERQRSV